MTQSRVLVIGGGLAGLSATMRLAELGVHVDLVSLVPVKRSHSVCAQGGINSVNAVTRQQGDNEYKHLDDTVYGGDFLQHQPPVKEMADWAQTLCDLFTGTRLTRSTCTPSSARRIVAERPAKPPPITRTRDCVMNSSFLNFAILCS